MIKVTCQQTHSANVHIVTEDDFGKVVKDCDGLVTNLKNVLVSIKTADCAPIIIRDDVKQVVSVVHAGWRGTQKGIVKNAIKLIISRFGSNPKNIKIKIGPTIDKNNFLIRRDVFNLFKDEYGSYLEKVDTEQWKLDLVGVNIKQLLSVGVLEENIVNSGISTYLNKEYPSYRRDGKSEGFETSVVIK